MIVILPKVSKKDNPGPLELIGSRDVWYVAKLAYHLDPALSVWNSCLVRAQIIVEVVQEKRVKVRVAPCFILQIRDDLSGVSMLTVGHYPGLP